jgi:hypothetical protein
MGICHIQDRRTFIEEKAIAAIQEKGAFVDWQEVKRM